MLEFSKAGNISARMRDCFSEFLDNSNMGVRVFCFVSTVSIIGSAVSFWAVHAGVNRFYSSVQASEGGLKVDDGCPDILVQKIPGERTAMTDLEKMLADGYRCIEIDVRQGNLIDAGRSLADSYMPRFPEAKFNVVATDRNYSSGTRIRKGWFLLNYNSAYQQLYER